MVPTHLGPRRHERVPERGLGAGRPAKYARHRGLAPGRRGVDPPPEVRDELGEIGELNFAGNRVVMMMGEQAQEAFFRGEDEQLDQAEAYPFMTPVFGKGVVFDGTPEQRKQAMKNQSLRDKFMRGHAEVVAFETRRMMETLGDEGEFDLLDFFSELTLYTSSACLIGKQFRDELNSEYFRVFYDLEKGTDAIAYVNPLLPLPGFAQWGVAPDGTKGRMHVVQPGDTLWDIALRFEVTVESIVEANDLEDETAISIDQELVIPADGGDESATIGGG